MNAKSQEKNIVLTSMDQGHVTTVVITGAQGPCRLQFKHAASPDWHNYPGFDGTPINGVVVQDFRSISATMRISFVTEPTAEYDLSVVSAVQATF